MQNPKICIAFNSGAAGDFLVSLLTGQIDDSYKMIIDENGMVINNSGRYFKLACEQFFRGDKQSFNNIRIDPVVNTHYCYREIIDLFPECKFYFIDDSEYVDITTEAYIDKRLAPVQKTLTEWLHRTNSFKDINKIKNLTDSQIKIVMKNDWKKCLRDWKELNLIRINFADIINREKCCKLVENILQSTVDVDKFNLIYNAWAHKNTKLITAI